MFYAAMVTFLASLLIWVMFAISLGFFLVNRKFRIMKIYLFIFFSVVLAWLFSQLFKSYFSTVRPFRVNGFPPLTITEHFDNSFPSGHTASAFALATSLFFISRRFAFFMFFLSVFVGIGRVLSNVHYPIDVLGGAVLGAFIPIFLDGLFFRNRKT